MFPSEPAIKSYFFGKGYKDLFATISASWQANQKTAEAHFAQSDKGEMLPRAFHIGAGLSVFIFGTAFFLLLSAVHVAVLGAIFLAMYITFSTLWLFERAWLAMHGFFTVCPSCHSRKPLPAYVCSCGATHTRLIPSSYGILYRLCNCGKRLPATFFLNRGKLISKCQDCGHFLSRAHTEAKKSFVPVIGGPSAGKTAYLTWLVADLGQRASEAGLDMEFLDSADKDAFETRLSSLQVGHMPDKTVETTPSAFNIVFSIHGNPQRNLYLYDPAGEAYAGEAELIPHRFLDYCSGILLLVDPFSISVVQKRYGVDPESPGELRPSKLRPDDLLDRLIFVLEKYFHLDAASAISIPIAIVLTKVDAFDLRSVLGQGGDEGHLIEAALRDWGMTPLVEILQARFSRRRYFTSSAVGLSHKPGDAYHPCGVAEPFDWLMAESNTQLFEQTPDGAITAAKSGYLFGAVPKATVGIVIVLALIAILLTWGISQLLGNGKTPEPNAAIATKSVSDGTTPLVNTPTLDNSGGSGLGQLQSGSGDVQPVPDNSANQPAPATTAKPSFDCSAAKLWAELQVCSNADLAQKDQAIADLYHAERARLDLYDTNAVLAEQRSWLRERNACETATDPTQCLEASYQSRLAQLQSRTAWAGSDSSATSPNETETTPNVLTLILNPGVAKDIWTTSVYSYAAGGGGPGGGLANDQLRVGGWGDQYWSLIQFDLANYPVHARSAILKLYNGPSQTSSTAFDVYVIDESWGWQTGDRLWWRNRPTAMHKAISMAAPDPDSWVSIDITDVYNSWQSRIQSNFGIALIPVSTNNAFDQFRSSRFADEEYRPRIVIIPD